MLSQLHQYDALTALSFSSNTTLQLLTSTSQIERKDEFWNLWIDADLRKFYKLLYKRYFALTLLYFIDDTKVSEIFLHSKIVYTVCL